MVAYIVNVADQDKKKKMLKNVEGTIRKTYARIPKRKKYRNKVKTLICLEIYVIKSLTYVSLI